ncbi:MAG TPA: hypothetical protein VEH77_11635 [Roseiarcus sp.]|nr:hypothetical protein [Roseiarcus sp.]
MEVETLDRYHAVIDDICNLNWRALTREELMAVCAAYYYFSAQFVEAVDIACGLYPSDPKLAELREGECDTANLSPYPGVAKDRERMNHDEFIRRAVAMSSLGPAERARVEAIGRAYLDDVHRIAPSIRAMSLSSYEDEGLPKVFSAILKAPDWDEPSLEAFKHFLVQHVALDSGVHGALCRHLIADDRVLPLWKAFQKLFVDAAPSLAA